MVINLLDDYRLWDRVTDYPDRPCEVTRLKRILKNNSKKPIRSRLPLIKVKQLEEQLEQLTRGA